MSIKTFVADKYTKKLKLLTVRKNIDMNYGILVQNRNFVAVVRVR